MLRRSALHGAARVYTRIARRQNGALRVRIYAHGAPVFGSRARVMRWRRSAVFDALWRISTVRAACYTSTSVVHIAAACVRRHGAAIMHDCMLLL